ncbi:Ig-like domain-containing protein, partial [Mycobacterium sp. URHB0044]|uniref:Ig-like domain-containing protein n=1 Tax=Mycobacterium sp. URHB0044 TaxID=1380386 RepID=UPI0012DF6009
MAIALGVGAAVATGHGLGLGQARADTGSEPSGTSTPESSSDTSPTAQSGAELSAPTEQSGATSSSPTATPPVTSDGNTPQPTHDNESAPAMQFASSGGADTSTNDRGQSTDHESAVETAPVSSDDVVAPAPDSPATEVPVTAHIPDTQNAATTEPTTTGATVASPTAEAGPPNAAEQAGDAFHPVDSTTPIVESSEHVSLPPPSTLEFEGSVATEAPKPLLASAMHFAALGAPSLPLAPPLEFHPLMTIPAALVNIAATLVAAVFSPFLAPGPIAPAHPPLLWAVLAWVRREIQYTFFNRTPHVRPQEVTVALDPGEVSDPIAFDAHDSDGDALIYRVPDRGDCGGPAHGTVIVDQSTGTFTYDPDDDYVGTDQFTVTVSDAANCFHFHGLLGFLLPHFGHTDRATVTLNVAGNSAPIGAGDAFSGAEDNPVSGNVLTNDTDPQNTPLTAILGTGPAHGTVMLATNGSFTYTPAANYSGVDSFTYQASDGTAVSESATVTITVTAINDAPVAGPDGFSTYEDTSVSGHVLGNDVDLDGDPLVASLTIPPAHGTVALNPNGSFTYTPSTNYYGVDSFSYVATDGVAVSAPALVTITIGAVNDAPVAVGDSVFTNEDTALTGNVLTNDTDVENAPLTTILDSGPGHGSLNLNADGTFTYTPVANYNGPDSFTYTATDGSATSAAATVSITVTAVDDTPVAIDDGFTTNEDTQLTGNVLTNDTDIEATNLT